MLEVLYEDNHIIAAVKPFGVLSQGDNTGDDCITDHVKKYISEKYNKPGEVYLGLVHRLDRVTGGVMVFARTSKAASRLSEQIRKGSTKKKYYAYVSGDLGAGKKDILKNYLIKDEDTNIVRCFDREVKDSKYAELSYRVISFEGGESLLEIDLKTGRSHQIRVQLAHIGHAITGDAKYGGRKHKDSKRIRLWSYYFAFEHPTLKELVEVNTDNRA